MKKVFCFAKVIFVRIRLLKSSVLQLGEILLGLDDANKFRNQI